MSSRGALALDLVCVLVFAAVGRASHAEGVTLAGLAVTAWPFLAGALVGTAAAARRRRPGSLGSGLLVWLGTVLLGLLLRALTGAGVAASFVVVTAVVLAAFLLGWRGLVRVAAGRVAAARR